MFTVPAFRIPWAWAGIAFLIGTVGLAYPLLWTLRPVRQSDGGDDATLERVLHRHSRADGDTNSGAELFRYRALGTTDRSAAFCVRIWDDPAVPHEDVFEYHNLTCGCACPQTRTHTTRFRRHGRDP